MLSTKLRVLATLVCLTTPAHAQFELGENSRINPDDFSITMFATDLNYPVAMVELEDESILVAVSNGASFFSSTSGQIIRLVDENDDGISDQQTVIEDQLPIGGPTALKKVDDLLFLTGQGKPISIMKLGPEPNFKLTELGRININDGKSWMHPNSALAARRVGDLYEIYFPLGSKANFVKTTQTRYLGTTFGLSAELSGDAIHRIRFSYDGQTITGIDVIQIATGLRSASGLAFHPVTGDLYFEDNGIDGLEKAIEAHSADEINFIPNGKLGGDIEDFGFPDHYIEYRTGKFIGGGGIPPLVAFTPIPNPANGSESEGPNEISFAPPNFPPGLNNGLFVGFHGQFSSAGLANEENPLVYVDIDTGQYFHFVNNNEPNVGHLDGLLASRDRLYVSDISRKGSFDSSARNSGAIYQIRHVGTPTVINEISSNTPAELLLHSAFPNPFNATTTIRFNVPAIDSAVPTELTVYDITGQRIRSLLNEDLGPGNHTAIWNGLDNRNKSVASGIYLYRLQVGNRDMVSGRLTLVR